MFVILSYDVDPKRDHKVVKLCRRFLTHRQLSVFDGIITGTELERLKSLLSEVIKPEADSICIYKFESLKFSSKESIGSEMNPGNII